MDYLIFLILAPLAAATLVAAIVSVWPYRHVQPARLLLLCGATIAGWLIFNTGEVLATTPHAKLTWARLTYVFIATGPLAWLTFALAYTDRNVWLRWSRLALLMVIPALTILLAFTNDVHGLIWRTYTFYEVTAPPPGPLPDTFLGIQVAHGPGYWLFALYTYACLIASSVLMIREHQPSFSIYRQRAIWAAVAVLAPLIANIIYLFDLIPGWQKDYSPLVFAFGTGIFTVIVRRYRLLDLKPIARNVLIDKMRDGMLVLDASHRIVDLNPEAAAIFALDDRAVIGQHIGSVLRPEHDTMIGRLDDTPSRTEVRLASEGLDCFYELSITPLTDPVGRITGRLLVLHDVTLRKQHEEMLAQAKLKLEAEYEELDAFSHTVAHDLKNPVHSILGFSEILEEEYDSLPDDVRRDAIETITRTALKMQQIIHELLLLANIRRYPVQPQPINTAAIIAEVLERTNLESEKRGARITVANAWPTVLGYAPWVEEIWSNYVENALKYAGTEPHIELGYTPQGNAMRFWVRDNGPGVPVSKQGQLFVPFSRLGQPDNGGHGLGLSIVRRIMERLGGDFGMESSGVPGEGSTFYFTLPLAPTEKKVTTASSMAKAA